METVISFTPAQLVGFITAIGGAVAAIGTMAAMIFKLFKKIKQPEIEQNERIKALEEENKARKEEIVRLNERLETGDNNFKDLEKTNKIILRSLQALLRHSLGTAEPEALKVTMKELDNYLVEK